MEAKASRIASCDAIHSPPWEKQRRWVPVGSKGWPQMQWIAPKANEWERPNLVRNAKEKTLEGRQKGGMTGQTKKQTFAPRFTQDLKCAWCKLKVMSKMMLKKEWLCNIYLNVAISQQITWKEEHMPLHLRKEFPTKFQMGLEGEWTKVIGTYRLQLKQTVVW